MLKIKNIKIDKFAPFNNKSFDFCDGLNVIIGDNGSGKTRLATLLENYSLIAKGCVDCENLFKDSYFEDSNVTWNDNLNLKTYFDEDTEWHEDIVGVEIDNIACSNSDSVRSNFYPSKKIQELIYITETIGYPRQYAGDSLSFLVSKFQDFFGCKLVPLEGDREDAHTDLFGLDDGGNTFYFSSSQKKLLSLASHLHNGFIRNGSIVIFDEFNLGFDNKTNFFFLDILLKLAMNDVQVFYTTMYGDAFSGEFKYITEQHLKLMRNSGQLLSHQWPNTFKTLNSIYL